MPSPTTSVLSGTRRSSQRTTSGTRFGEAETLLSILDPYGADGSSPSGPWGLDGLSSEYAIEQRGTAFYGSRVLADRHGPVQTRGVPPRGIEWMGLVSDASAGPWRTVASPGRRRGGWRKDVRAGAAH